MRIVDFDTYLNRVFWSLLGAFFALNVLTLLGRGDFRTEAVVVILATLPLVLRDFLKRRTEQNSKVRSEIIG